MPRKRVKLRPGSPLDKFAMGGTDVKKVNATVQKIGKTAKELRDDPVAFAKKHGLG